MSVFKTAVFARFARKAGLQDEALLDAARAVTGGHGHADLGGGVFKQRVARRGGGKSGGFRTIVLFKAGPHAFFVHGFAKNNKANVTPPELRALKALADILLGLTPEAIEKAERAGEIVEITHGEDGEQD